MDWLNRHWSRVSGWPGKVAAKPVTVTAGSQTVSGTGFAAIRQSPDGTTTNPAVTHPTANSSAVAVQTPTAGDWLLTWVSTGPAEADEIAIYARPPGHSAASPRPACT